MGLRRNVTKKVFTTLVPDMLEYVPQPQVGAKQRSLRNPAMQHILLRWFKMPNRPPSWLFWGSSQAYTLHSFLVDWPALCPSDSEIN
jgi:hypothetical protein